MAVKIQVEVFRVVTSPWRWGQQGPLNLWFPTTPPYGVTTQKTLAWKLICVFEIHLQKCEFEMVQMQCCLKYFLSFNIYQDIKIKTVVW